MLNDILGKLSLYLPYVMVGFVISLFLTRLAIFILPRIGFIDIPRGRHQHVKPIPRGGGIAIWISFFVTVFLLSVTFKQNSNPLHGDTMSFLLNFLGPAVIILITGDLDDRYELRSIVKLLAQILAGVVFYFTGNGITHFSTYQLPMALGLAVTVMWCVIIINAFNLIDGLDGIASGLAAISSFLLAVWTGSTGGSEATVVILLIFSACSLGFLRYNFSPAKIFMGDTGSMFLGLFFAYVSMLCSAKSVTLTTFFVPLAAIGVPVFDVFLAIWRRFFRRYIKKQADCSIMQGDHDHLHHRIQHETGSTHKTAYIIYTLSITFSLLTMGSVLLQHRVPAMVFVLLLVTVFVMIRCSSIEVLDTLSCVVKGLQIPHRNIVFTIAHPVVDALIIFLAFWGTRLLFRDMLPDEKNPLWFVTHIGPFVLILCLSGIYSTFWLRVGIRQYYKLLRLLGGAVVAAYVLNCCILVLGSPASSQDLWKYTGFCIAFGLLAGSFIVAERFVIHYYESFGYRHLFLRNQVKRSEMSRVLLYGGGLLCRIYISEQFCGYNRGKEMHRIVGILDDDQALKNLNVYGFKVLGGLNALEQILNKTKFDRIVVTSRNIKPECMEQLKTFCESHNISLQRFVCQIQDL